MARRVVIASQKGGVGKTTVALNLAVALAERGRRTLLADLDPQGAIGLSLARGDTELAGLAELLAGVATPADAIVATRLAGLSLLSRGRLDATDVDSFEAEVARADALEKAFSACDKPFDLLIVDTPSGLGRVTTAALACADFVLLAFQTESLSLRSVGQVLKVLEHVQATRNPRLRLVGILPTLVDRERPESHRVLSEIWSGFPDALETIVPRTEAFALASTLGVPVGFLGEAGAPEARRFDLLADEIEGRMNRLDGLERVHELSPPASSSDIEIARDIALRLHQRRRRPDRPGPGEAPVTRLPASRPRPEPASSLAPLRRPAPATPALEATPEVPSWDEPAGAPLPPGDASDPLAGFGEPDTEAEAILDTAPRPHEVEVGEAGVSPEEMVGSANQPFDALPEPEPDAAEPSPFDVDLDESDTSPEGDFGAPARPSWDDIVETCLGLAQAGGAMLVDPSGQVFAARGEWPDPGPDAIAAKLVSTMARTLRDAPTRSISAPLMGRHLTAWRVPLTEGLVTAAFIGDAPVRAEARPGIDTEIHRGAGA